MPDSDEILLQRAVEGDAVALRDLLKRCGPLARASIQGTIDKRWRTVLDEDDVMQIAYLEAFLHIDQLVSRDMGAFVTWLSRIAQNALRDAIRGLQREKRPNPAKRIGIGVGASSDSYVALLETLGTTRTTPSQRAAVNEAVISLEAALNRLPTDYRKVVQLYDLDGLSIGETAVQLGRSAGAVHMLRARAHENLRQLLGGASLFYTDAG
ncbi:MAG: sigma-70 family RNA polymerase sigma factor [Pyrinomonadaceae bacterium]|nr:sigma-70 family RNA polymerase sigma factor [Phycisphaerales bacterium]